MKRKINIIGLTLFFTLTLFSLAFSEESITITTYYPSPYGSYNELTTTGNTYLATNSGRVGIGTTGPSSLLHIQGATGGTTRITINSGTSNTWHVGAGISGIGAADFGIYDATGAVNAVTVKAGGNVGIGTASPVSSAKLDVAGEIHSSDTSSGFYLGGGAWSDNWARLTTNAGGTYHDLAVDNFWAAGAQRYDLAEVTPVRAEDKLKQGEVVVIDKKNGLIVTRSKKAYDTSVYGIVSSYEQASMVIGGIGGPEVAMKTNKHLPIALIGRVKAKVSAENGAIQIGDLLTTSNTPGYLMKCDNLSKCAGAIAGKALESLEKDKKEIIVLVTLQ